ncbi:hypothetical protein JCM8208_004783 [Rhodotorula glutinis]
MQFSRRAHSSSRTARGVRRRRLILGTTWVALFGIVAALSIAFHFVVELPSKMIGEVFVEALENWDGEGWFGRRRAAKAGAKLTKNKK